MKSQLHFLSVIVPIYRQEATIKKDLLTILKTLDQIRYPFELIAVIDGKNSDNSFKIASSIKHPHLKVTGYSQNHGKGFHLLIVKQQGSSQEMNFAKVIFIR